jgi:hypothetical protein
MNLDFDTLGKLALGGLIVMTIVLTMGLLTVREIWRWFRGHFSGFDDLSAKRTGGKVILSGALVDVARVMPKRVTRRPVEVPAVPDLVVASEGAAAEQERDRAPAPARSLDEFEHVPTERRALNFGGIALAVLFIVAAVAWAATRVG